MPAGANIKIDIYSITDSADDDVGGATRATDEPIYVNMAARLQPLKPEPLLLAQGIETRMMYRCWLKGDVADVNERDEVEISSPSNHAFYEKRFQIVKIQRDSLRPNDRRSQTEFTLRRYEQVGRVG